MGVKLKMLKVGFVGWRGMVGSVLLQRMMQDGDFSSINPVFFSTSNVGGNSPEIGVQLPKLSDAYSVEQLAKLDVIVTAQGSEYTQKMLPELRNKGFSGYWLDASSGLRMDDDAVIALDPINKTVIDAALNNGIKNYCVGNCTVSLMLMALGGLFEQNLVEWVNNMTYQAASGAGANSMRELLSQSGQIYLNVKDLLNDSSSNILAIDDNVSQTLRGSQIKTQYLGAPLAGSVIPWIDCAVENGQTREEWKGAAETNKILGLSANTIKVDGLCVRVGSMRCHSQAITLKLTDKKLSIDDITQILLNHNQWVKIIPNNKPDTLKYLSPAAVSGTLDIVVGRLRKLTFGEDYLTLFTVGDQLLWGAAEPLRRMLNIVVKHG